MSDDTTTNDTHCPACDGEGSKSYQWGKAAMLRAGGSRRPFSDSRPGFYYVDAAGREMSLKTISGPCSVCWGTGKATADDDTVSTLSSSLPHPTRSVALITEYLADMVQQGMGTKNGRTALYWHLIYVIQQHAGRREKEGE